MSQKQARRIRQLEEKVLMQRLENKILESRISANEIQITFVHSQLLNQNKKPQRFWTRIFTKYKLKHSFLG